MVLYINTALAILISLLLAYLISGYFVRIIDKGIKYTKLLAEGNLSAKLDIDQNDELGQMGLSLKEMGDKIKHIIHEIAGESHSVAEISNQLSTSAQQIAEGATEQASSVEEVSSSMEQIVANIEQNTANSQETEKISQAALRGMNNLKEASINSLESAKLISEKISVINEIASQTNILSLNAAVEASRSGSGGKGFAVIASEVRKLAEKSKEAADHIIKFTIGSKTATEKANKLLEELLPELEKSQNMIREITTSSIEQNSGSTEINTAVQELNTITQRNASSSDQLAASAEELFAKAERLNELIAFFNVNKDGNED
jgi:methyl-accepting chemotaxis protein